ncbi:MAG: AI-2E family transporter [Ferruginibacter sp.]
MNGYIQLPYYVKLGVKMLVFLLAVVLIYFAKGIIVPLYFSFLLSVLLLPVTNFMERKKIPRIAANLFSIIIALLFIAVIIYFLSLQITYFLRDVPSIEKHLSEHYATFQAWMNDKLHISLQQQTVMLQDATEKIKTTGGFYIGHTFTSLTQVLFMIVLVSIYSFLMLYYRPMLLSFLFQLFQKNTTIPLQEILTESKGVVKNYMTGLLIEMAIVAAANSIILFCLGIKYCVFLGVFAAMLNIIPYIGIFTGTIFAVLVTLTTSSHTSDIAWIVVSFAIVHFIDSNFLMPRIVGSKVKINALITIIGVVAGGTLMGLSGIFLALPTIAILKIIFDRIDGMKHWGMLLGDDITGTRKSRIYGQIKKVKPKPKKNVVKVE